MKTILTLISLLISLPVYAQTTVTLTPKTDAGLLVYRNLDLNTTDVAVKAGKGQLYGYFLYNGATTTRYFKIYNGTTAQTTVGTSTPILTIAVPTGSGANVFSEIGISFSTAITVACTTGVADSDTTAPATSECVGNFYYR